MSPMVHKVVNGSGEVKTLSMTAVVSLQAVTISLALGVIGFLYGGNSTEARITARLASLESSRQIQDERVSSLAHSLSKHLDMYELGAAHRRDIDVRLKLLEQRVDQLHPRRE